MDIYWEFENLKREPESIITVGTFDGVHLAHQRIIETLKIKSQCYGGRTTVITFEPHPQLVLKKHSRPPVKILTPIDEKIRYLKELGLERLIILRFTQEFSRMEPASFIKDILIEKIGFQEIIIGYDHAFGRERKGQFTTLQELSQQFGFRVDKIPPFRLDGEIVSSTRIRNLLSSGLVEKAAQFLGRYYSIAGRVIRGEGRGRSLTFPTANIQPLSEDKLLPENGVYAVQVTKGNETFKGVLNIGMRPTFSPPRKSIEVHILNFSGELYGEVLELKLLKKI
ncbi:MAG: bifunctional riboflavin kinase/FAD synthetase, partial [candidate division KSB1 bacterium]|nr:bifunctional riboflavin kinase/FAD synthetase [candidate division KSB1 bacterium]